MWKTYRHTGSEEDYSIYKEALNQATAEIRNSKRSYEQKIAFNIKHDSKSFYAYVRSKQKVQDKVGPLEGSDGNIITEGFLMAENLNEYFSSVFTREDISILPVLETKFEGSEFDYLGQLIVTPTMVAMKIRHMKDNKSPGVDGIPPKLLLEIVEQISIFSIQNFHDIKIFLFIMFVMQNHTVTVYPNVIILRCIVTVL